MRTPATAIDARFSDPDATATEWGQTRLALEQAELFWLSTVRADGRPHVTPVVAVWAQDAVWFATGATEQKFVNLTANPSVVLTTGCNRWDGGLDVVVEGKAVLITDDTILGRISEVFAGKWDGRWQYTARDGCFQGSDGTGAAMVFSVTPTTVFAHAKGDPFGATTHRFDHV